MEGNPLCYGNALRASLSSSLSLTHTAAVGRLFSYSNQQRWQTVSQVKQFQYSIVQLKLV